MYHVGSLHEKGLGVPKNRPEAIRWYRKSAAAGYKRAKERLKNWGLNPQTTCPQACPDAQAHWKLKPPKWPVTSTASPIK
jgi:TPR repeat protein